MFDWHINHDIVKLLDLSGLNGTLMLRIEWNNFW